MEELNKLRNLSAFEEQTPPNVVVAVDLFDDVVDYIAHPWIYNKNNSIVVEATIEVSVKCTM